MFELVQPGELYAYIPDERPDSIAALEARFARLAAGAGDGDEVWRNWLAFDDGAPVAWLQASIYRAARAADVAWIVFPRYWRRGYGVATAAWMLGELARDGIDELRATIDPRNLASLRVAEKLGFARTGTLESDVVVSLRIRQRVA